MSSSDLKKELAKNHDCYLPPFQSLADPKREKESLNVWLQSIGQFAPTPISEPVRVPLYLTAVLPLRLSRD